MAVTLLKNSTTILPPCERAIYGHVQEEDVLGLVHPGGIGLNRGALMTYALPL
jgi:hypothetical protein